MFWLFIISKSCDDFKFLLAIKKFEVSMETNIKINKVKVQGSFIDFLL